MAGDAKIVQKSEELTTIERDARDAASALTSASSSLDAAIPSDAFGVAGTAIAAAGNQFGKALGSILASMAKTATLLEQGTAAARTEFERVDDEASALFKNISIGGER
jgi:hypothetical protein